MQLAKVEVNSGSDTSFWFARWSQLGSLIELTGERGCLIMGIPINSTVERVVQTYRARRHRFLVYQQIEKEILSLRRQGLNQQEDACLWKRDNGDFKPDFSTSQTWNIVRTQSPKVTWFKGIWFREATPKLSFIAWLAIQNRLATGDRIIRWNPQAITTCWLCNSAEETRDHLFFECGYSKEVWRSIMGNLAGHRNLFQWSQIVQILIKGLRERVSTFLFRYGFQVVIYAIWYERNVRRVGEASQTTSCMIRRLDKMVRNRITTLRKNPGGKYEKAMEVWFGRN
ncbi:uncharacterized protein LOC130508739 [Raphanus sativus]|uniref:Uncharacterized protein LOC108845544 n=1 Tax=Raphanus sativus TaxID=3726 RepID=A0A6J0MQQ7_RAPSA|nr:uncharacterized protein LOC108845544 [Raphanus sativus]XP_056860372.1 uncharacterized protein LOC130508739 [Raphanus sativus]